MQVYTRQAARKKEGYILLVTLGFAIVLLIVLGSTMAWIISNSTITQRNNQFVASQYAAEAATEKVLGQMAYDWLAGTFSTNPAVYEVLVPTSTGDWPVQYVFSDGSGDTNQISVVIGQPSTNWVALPSPYTGLKAFIQPVTIAATATPTGQRFNVPATISQTANLSSIPIFQYLIFYNMNLEIAAADTLNIDGPVFSNAGFWSGSTTITFSSTVWAVSKTVVNGANNPFVSYTGSGSSTYTMKGQPLGGANHVTMPIAGTNNDPTVVEGILQWPPPAYSLGSSAAYYVDGGGQFYLANEADLIISNAASGVSSSFPPIGTNLFVYYQDQYQPYNPNPNNFSSAITWVTNDYYLLTNAGTASGSGHGWVASPTNYVPAAQWTNSSGQTMRVWYAGYSFLSNTNFYDWREGWNKGTAKTVQTVQIDVGNFNVWLVTNTPHTGKNYNTICQNDKNHPIGGVYVYNSVPLSGTVLPAVRVFNGSQLSSSYGFSIATPQPLYVWGDFNVSDGAGSDAQTSTTTHSRPASLLADSITILSNNWTDNNSNNKKPKATTTTIDAACLEGIVPSDPNLGTPGDSSQYSGGVENFLRLLESWNPNGANLYYNGSLIVMFPSQYATNRWRQTGNYYDAPNRIWSFDTNLTVRTKLPPFTPQMKTTIRNTWTGS